MCVFIFFPSAKTVRVPRHLLNRQCRYSATYSNNTTTVLLQGRNIVCVAFLTWFSTGNCTPQYRHSLRDAFLFSPCHLPPFFVPAPATFRASETQAAPGREKRNCRHPWILTIDPPMHNDGAASQIVSHWVQFRAFALTEVTAIVSLFAEGLSLVKHHRDRFSDAMQNTSFPLPSPIRKKRETPCKRPGRPQTLPSSFQVHFHAHVV